MKENVKAAMDKILTVTPEPEDYTGEDGLLYCGKCRTPKEAYFPEGKSLIPGYDRHPVLCACRKKEQEKQQAEKEARRHRQTVDRLKQQGFTDPAMREWTFANDNGCCQQMENAHFFVNQWELMQKENIGFLLWGDVGTGKSFFAGCIANALMEKETPVCMTNFARIINDLASRFEGRNEYIDRLCRYPLLILDDFGMERDTGYGLEQVYNVIDSRYRSKRPLIVTTNLTLDELNNAPDTARQRIYDRVLELCTPIFFSGENFRRAGAKEKMRRFRELLKERSANDRKESE